MSRSTQRAGGRLEDRAFQAEEGECVKLKAKERERREEAGYTALEGGEMAGLSPGGTEGPLKVLHREKHAQTHAPCLAAPPASIILASA